MEEKLESNSNMVHEIDIYVSWTESNLDMLQNAPILAASSANILLCTVLSCIKH